MKSHGDNEQIVAALRLFFASMRKWELDCTARRKRVKRGEMLDDGATTQALADLQELHRRHCTTWQKPARGGTFAIGAEYDPEGEKIVDIHHKGDTATVYTEQTTARPNNKYVYTLKKSPDGWRLVDDRRYISHDGRPQPYFL